MKSALGKLLLLIVMLAPLSLAAAETELAIPLAQPGDPMQAYLHITNGGSAGTDVELLAITASDEIAGRKTVSVASGETVSLAVAETFKDLSGQIAGIRAVHPATITVQLAFGVRPPERPKAFSVPV